MSYTDLSGDVPAEFEAIPRSKKSKKDKKKSKTSRLLAWDAIDPEVISAHENPIASLDEVKVAEVLENRPKPLTVEVKDPGSTLNATNDIVEVVDGTSEVLDEFVAPQRKTKKSKKTKKFRGTWFQDPADIPLPYGERSSSEYEEKSEKDLLIPEPSKKLPKDVSGTTSKTTDAQDIQTSDFRPKHISSTALDPVSQTPAGTGLSGSEPQKVNQKNGPVITELLRVLNLGTRISDATSTDAEGIDTRMRYEESLEPTLNPRHEGNPNFVHGSNRSEGLLSVSGCSHEIQSPGSGRVENVENTSGGNKRVDSDKASHDEVPRLQATSVLGQPNGSMETSLPPSPPLSVEDENIEPAIPRIDAERGKLNTWPTGSNPAAKVSSNSQARFLSTLSLHEDLTETSLMDAILSELSFADTTFYTKEPASYQPWVPSIGLLSSTALNTNSNMHAVNPIKEIAEHPALNTLRHSSEPMLETNDTNETRLDGFGSLDFNSIKESTKIKRIDNTVATDTFHDLFQAARSTLNTRVPEIVASMTRTANPIKTTRKLPEIDAKMPSTLSSAKMSFTQVNDLVAKHNEPSKKQELWPVHPPLLTPEVGQPRQTEDNSKAHTQQAHHTESMSPSTPRIQEARMTEHTKIPEVDVVMGNPAQLIQSTPPVSLSQLPVPTTLGQVNTIMEGLLQPMTSKPVYQEGKLEPNVTTPPKANRLDHDDIAPKTVMLPGFPPLPILSERPRVVRRPTLEHLCALCQKVYFGSKYGFEHHNLRLLKASATRGCRLCNLFYLTATSNEEQKLGTHEPGRTLRVVRDGPNLNLIDFSSRTIAFEFYKEREFDGPHPSDEGLKYRNLYEVPEDGACFSVAKNWIYNCSNNHPRCKQDYGRHLPTRVIDVRNECLLDTSQGFIGDYVALSHCWGMDTVIQTRTATLASQLRPGGIAITSLPPQFRDAFFITRWLRKRYLWIDSLCIVQDSTEDWAREASKMGDYYRDAFLTISALDCESTRQKILEQRKLPRTVKLGNNLYLRPASRPWRRVFREAPLSRRAWVLQERLLSTRILHYGREEMYWECLTCSTRESNITEHKGTPGNQSVDFQDEDFKRSLVKPDQPEQVDFLMQWYRIITQYSGLKLTRDIDKFPALSGLASYVRDHLGFDYVAGLWEQDLHRGLLWFRDSSHLGGTDTLETLTTWRAPSWSWASVNGTTPLLFDVTLERDEDPWDAEIRKVEIGLSGLDPMGCINYARIHMRVLRKSVRYLGSAGVHPYNDDYLNLIVDIFEDENNNRETKIGTGYLDNTRNPQDHFDSDGLQRCDAIYIAGTVATEVMGRESTAVAYFLLVEPVPGDTTWRRIGVGFTQDLFSKAVISEQTFLRCPWEDITLI